MLVQIQRSTRRSDLGQGLQQVLPDVLHAFYAAAEADQIVLYAVLCPLLRTLCHHTKR